jgi:hypothetical protein
MQAHGAARGGVGTPMPRVGGRLGGLPAVAAVLVVVAVMAAITWGMGAPATGGVGAEDANLGAGAGSALVHDDAGNMPSGVGSTVVHDDAGNIAPAGSGSALVHDDAGNVKP